MWWYTCIIIALLAMRASSEAAPTTSPPPIRCIGTKPAAICDSSHSLTHTSTARVLRAAKRLARIRCGTVIVILGPHQPTIRDTETCLLRIGNLSMDDVTAQGRILQPAERAATQRRMISRLEAGWSTTDVLLDAIRSLTVRRIHPTSKPPWFRFIAFFIAFILFWLLCRGRIAAAYLRPHYERCRRALKRLDDVRARTRAQRFISNICPICLEVLPPPISSPILPLPPITNTIYSSLPMPTFNRRSRVSHHHSNSDLSFDSNSSSTSSSEDEMKRRTLPCGHAFHEYCLLRWVASPARNRGFCPVCRTPARSAGGNSTLPPPPFSWRAVTQTLVSDNYHGESRRSNSTASNIVFEENSQPYSVQAEGGGGDTNNLMNNSHWHMADEFGSQLTPNFPSRSSSRRDSSYLSNHDLSSCYYSSSMEYS